MEALRRQAPGPVPGESRSSTRDGFLRVGVRAWTPIMQACPSCGDENSDRARFCQTCGGPLLAEPAGPREIRKTVMILFMDVVGSTELGSDSIPNPCGES